ncbi:hypothetical protein GCM10022212_15270 [Actimicrobium antarcticum]|uniref:Uncharacterized protein n=1 Tax=Actimicrobium antarcticum TaxID=1051899 RepID=A0ABP7T2K4_9BURK
MAERCDSGTAGGAAENSGVVAGNTANAGELAAMTTTAGVTGAGTVFNINHGTACTAIAPSEDNQ